MTNPYIPKLMKIIDIGMEKDVDDLKSFTLEFVESKDKEEFFNNFIPGQFVELTEFGYGEIPLGVANSPTEVKNLLFTVKKAGKVTDELFNSQVGKTIGVRGPYGNGWPVENMLKGKNLVMIGGGFAFSTLRSLLSYILDEKNRKDFGKLTVIYGCRTPNDFSFKQDLEEWEKRDDIDLILTIDTEFDGWNKKVGFTTTVTEEIAPDSQNSVAIVCGPPVMIEAMKPVLEKLGFNNDKVLVSLERRMKCGIGKCGRCNLGEKFVCTDGPVFSLSELKDLKID